MYLPGQDQPLHVMTLVSSFPRKLLSQTFPGFFPLYLCFTKICLCVISAMSGNVKTFGKLINYGHLQGRNHRLSQSELIVPSISFMWRDRFEVIEAC